MGSKIERVVEHIAQLGSGERVSVRGLAKDLGVSEGTAYQGIKAAEAQGLVITRPKAGTTRVNIRGAAEDGNTTLAEAARSIGAAALCGAERAAAKPLGMPVVADGSEQQLRGVVHRYGDAALCLVGDRPELHTAAVRLGIDVLLTGGTEMEPALLEEAERAGLVVLASEQDSATLLGMLSRRLAGGLPRREMASVRDWMQLPRYLYHDDMVMQWHRLYSDIFLENASCAVVDDSLKICGSVDPTTGMSALPALRLSEIMDKPREDDFVSEDMSMDALADMFVRSNRLFTAVANRDGMSGYIGLSDVVRYYQFNQTYRQFDRNEDGVLQLNSDEPGAQRRFYTVRIRPPKEEMNRSLYIDFLCSAAAWHAYDLLGAAVNIENATFYSPLLLTEPGEYLISSEVMKRGESSLVLELEMFDNKNSYLKSTLTVSGGARDADA